MLFPPFPTHCISRCDNNSGDNGIIPPRSSCAFGRRPIISIHPPHVCTQISTTSERKGSRAFLRKKVSENFAPSQDWNKAIFVFVTPPSIPAAAVIKALEEKRGKKVLDAPPPLVSFRALSPSSETSSISPSPFSFLPPLGNGGRV